jgi:rubrerythrin
MKPETLLFLYVLGLLGALSAIAIYYDFRRRRFEPTPTEDRIFRCRKCGFVYTDDADVDRSRCPQCGQHNDSYKF